MPDITAVPEGLSVRYGRDQDDNLNARVEMVVSNVGYLTDADDMESADWRIGRMVTQVQNAVRAIVAKWDEAEPAKHEITVSPSSANFLAQATCTCGWTMTGGSSQNLMLHGQEHLLENGIVR